ncbi:hypothetical protein EW146_g2319 [Bondarzewia mesenterica]|uniref:Uncharacterized protein n=1 Tax=Bondarzewia mesenterica TaxID=1095465 RepID=A0A4S4M2X1_9AGAM|nr:hypothetical protein EW146_g2319 [Bondarzewia mesenterica]
MKEQEEYAFKVFGTRNMDEEIQESAKKRQRRKLILELNTTEDDRMLLPELVKDKAFDLKQMKSLVRAVMTTMYYNFIVKESSKLIQSDLMKLLEHWQDLQNDEKDLVMFKLYRASDSRILPVKVSMAETKKAKAKKSHRSANKADLVSAVMSTSERTSSSAKGKKKATDLEVDEEITMAVKDSEEDFEAELLVLTDDDNGNEDIDDLCNEAVER